MNEKNPDTEDISDSTSDNRYRDSPNFYTARTVAHWIGVSPTRVRQLSQSYNIGQKREKYWIYSSNDITLLGKLTRKGKQPMRNVTPATDPDQLLRVLNVQDDLKKYMVAKWKTIYSDLNQRFSELFNALYDRADKLKADMSNWQMNREEWAAEKVKEYRNQQAAVIGQLAQELADLRKEVKEFTAIRPVRKRQKKEERGRGVLAWQDLAPPTQQTAYEAMAA